MKDIVFWGFMGLLLLNAVLTPTMVGKKREPISPRLASSAVCMALVEMWALWIVRS